MFSFIVMVLLMLPQHIHVLEDGHEMKSSSGSTENCYCVPMDRKDISNGTEPLFSQPLKILKECGQAGRNTCMTLCKTLATLAQYDPQSAKGFCKQVKRDIYDVKVSIFSKACDGEYEYTGLTFNKPICCKNQEHVPCSSNSTVPDYSD